MTNKEKVIITYLVAFFIYVTLVLFIVQGEDVGIEGRALIAFFIFLPAVIATFICDINRWFRR